MMFFTVRGAAAVVVGRDGAAFAHAVVGLGVVLQRGPGAPSALQEFSDTKSPKVA